MRTLELTKTALKEVGCFDVDKVPGIFKEIYSNFLPKNIPENLRQAITIAEICCLFSNTRRHIQLFDGTLVPINIFTIGLFYSGTSKDRSLNAVKVLCKSSYDLISKQQTTEAKSKAEDMSLTLTGTIDNWLDYYKAPPSCDIGIGTVEGIVNHFAETEEFSTGASTIYNSEVATELAQNPTFTDLMKVLAIGYDLGQIPQKTIKSHEHKTKPIKKLPINFIMFGSQDTILFDVALKNKFRLIFSTQMARRTLFAYSDLIIPPTDYTSIGSLLEHQKSQRNCVIQNTAQLQQQLISSIKFALDSNKTLTLSEDAQKIYDIYTVYNDHKANQIDSKFNITKLSRKHFQWRALKIAGMVALLNKNTAIELDDIVHSINLVELFKEDLQQFEIELNKDVYEVFADYCKAEATASNNVFTISIHELKKRGFLDSVANIQNKINSLIDLAAAYDINGIYYYDQDKQTINYSIPQNTDIVGFSYMSLDMPDRPISKQDKIKLSALTANKTFEYYEVPFKDLGKIFTETGAFCIFKLKDGIRKNVNIISGTNFVAFDIDNSNISAEECHLLLSDINHHIGLSNDPTVHTKFRLLVELDVIIDIDKTQWMDFIRAIGDELGLIIDPLNRAALFFTYGIDKETILSVTDATPIDTREILSKILNKSITPLLTKKAQIALLDNYRDTFEQAYEAENGNGSRLLIKAGVKAMHLGATLEQTINLLHDINNYWIVPMETQRFENTILKYIKGVYNQ